MSGLIDVAPKYRQLQDLLRGRIERGEYRPGDKFLSENEMVREFGVSKHTVLKALEGLVAQGVVYRRQGMGTFVSENRPSGEARQNRNIAILNYAAVGEEFSLVSAQVLAGFEQRFEDWNCFFTVRNTGASPEAELSLIRSLADKVDGLAIITRFHPGKRHPAIEALAGLKIPCVNLITQPVQEYVGRIASVCPDDEQGGYLAGRHLIERGCDIPLVLFPGDERYMLTNYVKRMQGFQKAFAEAGRSLRDENFLRLELGGGEYFYEEAGYAAGSLIEKALTRDGKVGVFALMSDALAIGLEKSLQEKKIRLPEQVLLCGFDNETRTDNWGRDLTTIDTHLHQIGYQGAELLLEQMEARAAGRPIDRFPSRLLPVTLIKRGST